MSDHANRLAEKVNIARAAVLLIAQDSVERLLSHNVSKQQCLARIEEQLDFAIKEIVIETTRACTDNIKQAMEEKKG